MNRISCCFSCSNSIAAVLLGTENMIVSSLNLGSDILSIDAILYLPLSSCLSTYSFHVSEISWTRHVKNPSEEYSMGDNVEAKVISIDPDERKISLGVKQLTPDPWDAIEKEFEVGSKYKGKVQNLTQFGAFVELKEGIDGLIHVSDLSWTKVVRHAKNVLEKDQEVEVVILEVSRENRKISLGMKQLQDDPWQSIVEYFESGKEVSGEIIRILDKGIIIQLEMDVEGIIPFGKMSKKDRRALASQYEVGANLSGIVMKVSPEDKKIILFKEELAGGGLSLIHI